MFEHPLDDQPGLDGPVPVCSVVIRCCNEVRHIGRLLNGIMQQTLSDVEIIVVDSGSTDGTLDIVKDYRTRVLHIEPEAFSFGRSLNLGCQAARGEFIVIASAHVYPLHEDWLERLLSPFADRRVALSYGRQCGDEQSRYSESQLFKQWFPDHSNLLQTHPFCNNANAAIRKSIWQRQPYDESLSGLEDLAWAQRTLAEGDVLAYVSDAEIAHIHDETPSRIQHRYQREAMAMKRIFPKTHFTLWDLVRLFTSNVLSDAYHAIHDKVFWRYASEIIMFRCMQFLGTWRGYHQADTLSLELKRRFYYPGSLARSAPATKAAGRQRVDYSTSSSGNGSRGANH